MKVLEEYFFNDPNKNLVLIVFIGTFIYLLLAFVMNSYNKLLWRKGTFMAFVPGFNIFLLGKFILNKVFGFILVSLLILSMIVGGKAIMWYSAFIGTLSVVVFCSYYKLSLQRYSEEYPEKESEDLSFDVYTKPNVAINNFRNPNEKKVFMPTNPIDSVRGMSGLFEEEQKKKISKSKK